MSFCGFIQKRTSFEESILQKTDASEPQRFIEEINDEALSNDNKILKAL